MSKQCDVEWDLKNLPCGAGGRYALLAILLVTGDVSFIGTLSRLVDPHRHLDFCEPVWKGCGVLVLPSDPVYYS